MPRGKAGPRPNDRKEPILNLCPVHGDIVLPDGATCYRCEKDVIALALSGKTEIAIAPADEDVAVENSSAVVLDNISVEESATTHGSNGHAKEPPPLLIYECDECEFETPNLGEIVEHVSDILHAGYSQQEQEPPEQSELFTEPGTIFRTVTVPLPAEEIAELEAQAVTEFRLLAEWEDKLEDAKESIKRLAKSRDVLAYKLSHPTKNAEVAHHWQICMEENSKKLIREDNGEVTETRALSEQDRAAELAKADAANAQQKAAGVA